MLIKKKTRAEMAYVYRMLLSFLTSEYYEKLQLFNFKPDSCVCYEAAFVGHNSACTDKLLNYSIKANL